MSLLKRKSFWLVLAIFVVGIWFWGARRGRTQESEIVRVERRSLTDVYGASGEVKAERLAILNFPTGGKLWFINVKEGDTVTKGKSLAGLDPRALSAAQQNAYQSYLAADANAKEVEDQVKGHDSDETFAQKNDRVAAQSARDKAYNTWQQSIVDHRNATLVSPIDGMVADITVNVVGDTVGVTDGVTVVDPDSLYFEFDVDEVDLGKVSVGDRVEIKLDAYPEQNFVGRVEVVDFSAKIGETGATVFGVKVKFDTVAVANLRVGLNGDATLDLRTVDNALTLPSRAVKGDTVNLRVGKKIQERRVEIGLETDEYVEVLSGLKEGDEVVVD